MPNNIPAKLRNLPFIIIRSLIFPSLNPSKCVANLEKIQTFTKSAWLTWAYY